MQKRAQLLGSAKDRAKTVMTLASPDSKPEDLNRPDELNYQNFSFWYRRKRDRLIERASVARLPLKWGNVHAYCYKSVIDGIEHIAMVKGDIGDGQDILVRVHSECLTGDIFGSARCDCGDQLAMAMEMIEKAGRGVLVYLRGHEGRGIGLGHKLRAYNLQDDGCDTVEANEELGLPVDSQEYGIGAQILRDLGVRSMKLMTNNPAKYSGIKGYGLSIAGRVPLITPITSENHFKVANE
ncbi:putative bifunctional riboflavin biosynthesis protein RIBA 2, chloroplastic [Zea mays]|uniref:Putative bifunctional riboflavin biosynthesis protein RIBA 2, chloroplastic n=1 Tax=Zea mays TaxID=4577 RepID=A0A3L6ES41_MAIZE|nr:putative bifunctional riboflavin biosynthesis protein RIBA 2, chloroplastic [Zea mays]